MNESFSNWKSAGTEDLTNTGSVVCPIKDAQTRFAIYRAAVQGGSHTDGATSYAFTPQQLARLTSYKAEIQAGLYKDALSRRSFASS